MAELKYVDWDGLVYYDGKIKQYIQDRDEDYVKMGGIISFAELPDPTYYNLHYIYKITDDFTSNSRFDEAGLVYKAGTWVQCIDVHDDASRYRYTIFNEEIIGGTADIDLSDYYTKKEVDERIEDAIDKLDIPQVDLNNYYTRSEVDELIPDVPTKVSELENDTGYITSKDVPQPELFVVDYNAPDFAAALEAYRNGKLLLLTNAAPDSTSYAVMNYVRDDMITFTKFLMSRSNTYGSFNTYYLHNDNTWELAKEVKLNKVDATVDANNDITGLIIGKDTYDFDNFATTETVNQLNETVQNIENTYVTNEILEQKNYVTEQHITENYITIQDAADMYVTNEQVTGVVTNEVETVVTDQIETKVTEVIEQKIENDEITVNSDSIKYDTWE